MNDFSLNSNEGDEVWLTAALDGQIVRFADQVSFGATPTGETFGRWPNGTGYLAPLLESTFGTENSPPRVGPLVIHEVMYAPRPSTVVTDAADLEFIEILNPTDQVVDLSGWQLTDAVHFEFPAGTLLQPDEPLVIVPFDPVDTNNATQLVQFWNYYGIDRTVRMVGGYSGRLNNAGETLRLLRAGISPEGDPTFVPRWLEDEVRYDDASPWPTSAREADLSLNRSLPTDWGNDASSWRSAPASPGNVTPVFTVNSVQVNAMQINPPDLPAGPQPSQWSTQRSRIADLTIEFSHMPDVSAADFTLTNLGVNAPLDPDIVMPLTDENVLISGVMVVLALDNLSLPDGVYQLEIGGSVQNLAVNVWMAIETGSAAILCCLEARSTTDYTNLRPTIAVMAERRFGIS